MIGRRENVSGAHFAFTDRWGGVSAAPYEELNLGGAVGDDTSAVTTNRELAAKSLGLEPDRVVWMNQVHGADVAVVDGPWESRSGFDSNSNSGSGSGTASGSGSGDIPSVDAIVTTRRGLALAVLTADCVPVLLADPVAGVVAAAHAGRPGMIAGVVPAAVRAMTGLGADPARVPDDHPVWDLAARHLAAGIASIVLVVSPERVIVGGGVLERRLLPRVRATLKDLLGGYVPRRELDAGLDRYVVPPAHRDPGLLGAFALAREALDEPR